MNGRVLHGSLLYRVLEHGNFLNISVSQGSVATCLRCGGIFNNDFIAILLTESVSGRILKITQHLTKLGPRL